MRNLFNISSALLLAFLVTISSCKKEEEIIEGCTDATMYNYSVTANTDDGSCIAYVYGCIDVTMFNYDVLANTDDGSCIDAQEIAQGVWNIFPDCEEYTVPIVGTTISLDDQMPETIDVQENGINSLVIDMNGTQILADIDNQGNIILTQQTVSIDMGFGPMDIYVEGDGSIESENTGDMHLTYTFEIPIIGGTEELDCHLSLTK